MKIVMLFLIAIIATSCAREAQSATQEGDFKVELIFTKDGCNVYRFMDAGHYVYWSNCKGSVQSSYSSTTGKTTPTHKIQSITETP